MEARSIEYLIVLDARCGAHFGLDVNHIKYRFILYYIIFVCHFWSRFPKHEWHMAYIYVHTCTLYIYMK